MEWKFLNRQSPPRQREQLTGNEPARAEEAHTMEFSPRRRQEEHRIRPILSCELHSSRSLLALGHCSRHCIKSCMLADTQRDTED